MIERIKVIDVELSEPLEGIAGLDGYQRVWVLVRLYGRPLGIIKLPVTNNFCSATLIGHGILHDLKWPVIRQYLIHMLESPQSHVPSIGKLFAARPQPYWGDLPAITVAVCTRDRGDSLTPTLRSLEQLRYPKFDVVVVDNAPSDDVTRRLVTEQFPAFRYVCEPRPGLDWARNRAALEARGEIIAYTDDDVIVDKHWLSAIGEVFAENPDVMGMTGLVVPAELETRAQRLFELSGGFSKGFVRQWERADVATGNKAGYNFGGTGRFGTGANMAFRRAVFDEIGLFDPALDVGTCTQGGGDLDMFFRVIKAGHTLVYEPAALVRHIHRREYQKLRNQLHSNGIGLFSYFDAEMRAFPDEKKELRRFAGWWLRKGHIKRCLVSLFHPTQLPADLIWAELKGCLIGKFGQRYEKAQREATRIEEQYGPQIAGCHFARPATLDCEAKPVKHTVLVLDLTRPLAALTDVTEFARTEILVTKNGWAIGRLSVFNNHAPISISRLRELMADQLAIKLLVTNDHENEGDVWSDALRELKRRLWKPYDTLEAKSKTLPSDVSVTILISTYDRPEDLAETLKYITALETKRDVEIIVVDNHPQSLRTPPVVAQFPQVRLIYEPRKGASYSRNTGICASKGDIIVSTDDDVVVPPDWLEKLIAPFVQQDVMVVSGNVLPYEQVTESQILFERYGGLGRGSERFHVDGDWFEVRHRFAVETWKLGGTANAAYRAQIFANKDIGMMNEELSTGGPAGLGEDIYLFYRVLKAGGTIQYEPSAYLWHKHRRSIDALKRQIYNYSKSQLAYHLITVKQDRDLRGLVNAFYAYPKWLLERMLLKMTGRGDWPAWFIWAQIRGYLASPIGFVRALRYVKKQGRSAPYVPVRRVPITQECQDHAAPQAPVGAHAAARSNEMLPMPLKN